MGYLNNQDILNVLRTPSTIEFTPKGFPIIKGQAKSTEYLEVMGYNYAKNTKEFDKTIHFYLEDYNFASVWNTPLKNMEVLKDFASVFSPDFSMYTNMPMPLQMFNHYRKQWCGAFWQSHGIVVYPTVGWSTAESFEWCFDGIPTNSVVTVSTVGVLRNKESLKLFMEGYTKMLEVLNPSEILLYGSKKIELDGNVRRLGVASGFAEAWKEKYE